MGVSRGALRGVARLSVASPTGVCLCIALTIAGPFAARPRAAWQGRIPATPRRYRAFLGRVGAQSIVVSASQYEASQYEASQYEASQYEASQYEASQYEASQG